MGPARHNIYYIPSLKFRSIVITGLEIRCNEANATKNAVILYKTNMQRGIHYSNAVQYDVFQEILYLLVYLEHDISEEVLYPLLNM